MFNNHLMKACLAAVFAIGLAACSSSDNGGTASNGDSTPAPSGPTQAELDAEQARADAAEAALQAEKDKQAADAAKANAKEALALFNSFTDTVGTTTTADVVTVAVTAVSDSDDGGGSAEVTGTATPTQDGDAVGPGVGGQEVVRTAESMLGAWQGTMLTDSDTPGNSSTVVVYTDVAANMSKPFKAVYATDAPAYNGTDQTGVTALLTTNSAAMISAPQFAGEGLKNHPANNVAGDMVAYSGTFDGAQGTYSCTPGDGTPCTSNMTSSGIVLAGGGGWSFDPVDTANVSQPDGAYAYFGWWLNKTASGNPEVDVFYGYTGGGAVTDTTFNALGGTATYTGAAAGKYAMNRGADQYATGGHWTADATLVANFEDPTAADAAARVSAAGSITGTIDNFMAGGESMDWSVKLNSTAIEIAADAADFTGDTVWTVGGADGAEGGSWEGAFYDQTTPEDGGNNVPSTVAGEFQAVYGSVGHMVGAFGANN